MLLYELIILDSGDPLLNPIWRQGTFVLPFVSRLGLVRSAYNWSLVSSDSAWTFESVVLSHICLSGLLILASFWHWAFWDLDVFISSESRLSLDLSSVFGIHFTLAASLCFGFGFFHLTGLAGPGAWTSDSYGCLGAPRSLVPAFSILTLGPFSYTAIPSHHLAAGLLGLLLGPWHILGRPGPALYQLARLSSIEAVLSTSIAAVFTAAGIVSALFWYSAGGTSGLELFGPTRFHWDTAYFAQNIEARLGYYGSDASQPSAVPSVAWAGLPDKILFYDYLGTNPAKGGLFRSGPMLRGDGVPTYYLGHPNFDLGSVRLSVRRNPAFFEGFPVILLDQGGRLRADIPFRRAESKWSIEQTRVSVGFEGGVLAGSQVSKPGLVKVYARKSLNGEIFGFQKAVSSYDGVFRTSSRGWYVFSHLSLALIFFFGHLWHAARAFFRDIWTGIAFTSALDAEYGSNEKLGDRSSGVKAGSLV
jgi:photosystem II CP47 chlorophyll apoprotein